MPSRIDRREFLRTAGASVVALGLPKSSGGQAQKSGARPNFVFILADDQRWDAIGAVQRGMGARARFPWLRTPNLDRLVAEGARFSNAFVVNSLCAPSRASFLTGQYGHLNGIVNNHTSFSERNATWASLLQRHGYATGFFGKWHMGSQKGKRPGFDTSVSFIGQGRYFDCPVEMNGVSTPTTGWIDDVFTDSALRFIRDNRERPFAMQIAYKAAHGPFEPPERRNRDYAGMLAREEPNASSKAIYNSADGAPPRAGSGPAPRDEQVPVNLNYFRCLTAMDDNVGRVLALLDELKLAPNTVVVFAGDNGFYLGEHGLGDKRSAYEESMRIPLIVRYPAAASPGRTVGKIALNVDLAPTVLDYAGVAATPDMQGRSWRPLLEADAPADWRKAFFYCYHYETGFSTPTTTAVRTEDAKLIRYPGREEWTEVFDLANDPYETRNLAADPAHADLRSRLQAEYDREARAIDFRIPAYADDPKRDRPGEPLNAWVLEYRFQRDRGRRIIDASGLANHGTDHGTALVDGRAGARARRFDGAAWIEVPKSPSINPAVRGWTVEVVVKPERPDGIVLASGGATNGCCLYLFGGKPAFRVNARNQGTTIAANDKVKDGWTTLTARIGADSRVSLLIDGREAASGRLRELIPQEPNDSMQIGADLGSPVVDMPLPKLVGLVESVRIYSGESPAPK